MKYTKNVVDANLRNEVFTYLFDYEEKPYDIDFIKQAGLGISISNIEMRENTGAQVGINNILSKFRHT